MKNRLIFLPLFCAMLGLFAFLRPSGAEDARAVSGLDLLVTGVGLGVALANVRFLRCGKLQF